MYCTVLCLKVYLPIGTVCITCVSEWIVLQVSFQLLVDTLSGTFQNNVSDFFRTLGFAMLDVNFYPGEKVCSAIFTCPLCIWNILMQTSYTINFGHCHFFFQSWFVSSSCDTKVTSWVSHGSCSSVSWWVTVNLCLCWNKCLTISTLHSVELLCLELYHALCNAKYIFGGFKRS